MQVGIGERRIKTQSLVDYLNASNFLGLNYAVCVCRNYQRRAQRGLTVFVNLFELAAQEGHVGRHSKEPLQVCSKTASFLVTHPICGNDLSFQNPSFRLCDAPIRMSYERAESQLHQGAPIARRNLFQLFDRFTEIK